MWTKTVCYIIKWKFNDEGIPIIDEDNGTNLNTVEVLSPETRRIIPIKEIKPNIAIKMLGVHIAGSLKNDTEYEKLTKKAVKFATAIQVCPLTKTQVILAIKTIYKPAIEYVLPATTFTGKQIQNIHKKVMPRMLSKSGISRNYPRALVFGPVELGGLGFPHIGYPKLAAKTNQAIKNVRANITLRKTFRIMMEHAQMQAWIEEQILSSSEKIKYFESEWIKSLQEGFQNIGAKITIKTTGHRN